MMMLSAMNLSWAQGVIALAVVSLACVAVITFAALFAQKASRWSLWKLHPVTLLMLATLSVVTANLAQKAGDRGGTGNEELRMENGEGGGPRSLPPELVAVSNMLVITDFAIDSSNKTVAFEVACSNILFDYAASRNLYLFSSTNLLEPRWMPLGAFAMPADTNICAFAVTTNDVDAAALPWFLDSMAGLGFYRFAADFDTDGDGLIDSYETLWTLTDPELADTDEDGLSDGDEIAIGTDPLEADTDGDGLSDGDEDAIGSNPLLVDTDGDGLSDGDEILTHETDPLLADTDDDGLSDFTEVSTAHTNPLVADTDGDGLSDGEEIVLGTNPLLPDTDMDGMPDGWEVLNALDPEEDDAADDADGDGLSNLDEWRAGTNPNAPDTDGDGLPDAVECARATISEDAVPWFDMTGATVISPAADVDSALYSCDLPFTNRLSAVLAEKAVADVNGIVYLGAASSMDGLCSRDECRDLSESLDFPGIAVAPYWSDLKLRTSLGSAISHKLASHSGTNYFVIQYSRVGTQGWSANSEFSFQVSVPETGPSNTVYVRYGTLVDGRGDACMVSIGAQASGGAAKVPLSFATPVGTPVESGTTVAYRFGRGTDPLNADTDGDGLPDGDEALTHGTDPLVADTDGDGLPDGWEVRYCLNPLLATGDDGSAGDPDCDGLSNATECATGTNPSVSDTDLDGLSDGAEVLTYVSNPLVADTDGDGIDDGDEVLTYGTSPILPDTDGDGLSDGWEALYGLDPLSASGDDGAAGDPDGDGVENARELALGTDPLDDDTDLDGLSDGDEAGLFSLNPSASWFDRLHLSPLHLLGLNEFTSDVPPEGMRLAIPNPLAAPGATYTHVSLDRNGVFHLYTNATDMAASPLLPCRDLSRTGVADSAMTVAPLWAPLEFGPQSVVRVYQNWTWFLVVEYERMRLAGAPDLPENEASVQTLVGVDPRGELYIRICYANVGSNVWNAASVGFRAPGGRTRQTFSFLGSRAFAQGAVNFSAETGFGTDPTLVDTDGDGLSDSAEVLTHGSSPLLADTDGDGLTDAQEVTHGTGLNNPDSDGDGLLDGWEVANQLNPLSSSGGDGASGDIDNDGLTNIQEQEHGGNPRSVDTDGDGLADPEELLKGTSLSLADTDHDGLPDGLEVSLDLDPLQPDSDGDGMNDGWEYQHRDAGFDPAVDNATDLNPDNDADADPDGDGLTNAQDCEWGTNPSGLDENHDGVPDGYDSDGDGVNDGAEIAQNSDPADASDEGKPDSRAPVSFYFGDPSGSHSEKYRLAVTPTTGHGDTPQSFSWLNENYGECETKRAMLKPGWSYEVRLYHAGTDPAYNGSPKPDYDYRLNCETGSLPDNVVVKDPSVLFGEDYTSDRFAGKGKVATIAAYAITGVKICKPDDSSWAELEEGRVVLDDEELRIKVEVSPQLDSLSQCRQMFGDSLTIKTSGTCPAGVSVPIGNGATFVNSPGKSEIRITMTRQQLKALGLLPPRDNDGVNEMAWVDVPDQVGQDLSDSTAFSALGYAFRGRATVTSGQNLNASPPISQRSLSFMKAAGCEVVSASYGDTASKKRQIMNQADYFYFSGHGDHYNNTIQGGFDPSMAMNYWNRDLGVVIIAGCSVLDINDYNGKYGGAEHYFSPGKAWEQTGPGILLGYANVAPGDAGGAPARIMNSWVANRGSLGDVNAWMRANANNSAWNACAIVKDVKFVYFEKFFFQKFKRIKEVAKGDW